MESVLLGPVKEGSLITNSRLEHAYANTQQNTNPSTTQDLWREILTTELLQTSSQSIPTFTISSLTHHSEVKAGSDLYIIISPTTAPCPGHDPRVLLALGFQGSDKDSSVERELLVVRFVEWAKRELSVSSGPRLFYGLLVVGTYARVLRYDKHEGVLKPFHGKVWLDAKSQKWRPIMDDVKKGILDAVSRHITA